MVNKLEPLLIKYLGWFLGKTVNLSLEEKLLRLMVFFALTFQGMSTVLNYYAQQNDEINILGVASTCFYLIVYIISFRKISFFFLFYLMVAGTLFSVFLAWKYFDGYDGTAFFILLILTIFYSLLSKGVHSIIVLLLALGLMTVLSFAEHSGFAEVLNYKDETAKFSDIYFTVLLAVISVFVAVKAIFNRYLLREKDRIEKMELQKRNEIITVQNLQLKELDSTKNKFFSIISHDLKSPISAVDSLLKLMDSEIEEMTMEEITHFVSVLRKSTNNLLQLTENLLTWASLNTNKISFLPEKINLSSLIDENSSMISQLSAKKKITILNKTDESIEIVADRNMMSLVIRNIVSNAVKYSFRNGTVTIETETFPERISVKISDNGIGMTNSQVEKLFRLDYSTSTPGSEGESGTGLGLVLCREFIDKHNGTIDAQSEPGRGSAFRIVLPYGAALDSIRN